MKNKLKRAKTSLIIGIILMIILVLAIICEWCVFLYYNDGYGDMAIEYRNLKTVMAGDVLYLSDDFMQDAGLEVCPIYKLMSGSYDGSYFFDSGKYGDVHIEFNPNRVIFCGKKNTQSYDSKDFQKRVKHIDLYRYDLLSKEETHDIPVKVSVVGAVGANKNVKYDNKLPNGDRYAILDSQLAAYLNGKGKSYEVKGVVGKTGVIKKYGRLKITVTVDVQTALDYSDKEIEERVDGVLNTALNYIVRFQ